ncbi:alpha/beta hydrolase [Goodfellowiella coeruleoviolacea]|uniref:Serine aminopeptidase S33 domain-containing protein n=1 Tax=Goodfellowiella coeruleoviolacea TaxID=334858 RepID=A0AAE3GKZ5_9PSEU|nr:alpha/beta hydrolase [Goodfellowiella coeruleoviolacea]MCP2169319.1 hypothetical protein [Goodfellowiella coeruleoviolacea]
MPTSLELTSVDGVALDAVVHPATATSPLGTVVLAHGLTADKDGSHGRLATLAEELVAAGFAVLRFSFRGHGASGGTQRGVTIAGAMLDLEAAVGHADAELPAPVSVVAASFGAVPTCLTLPYLDQLYSGLVLWNPVLNLHRTFIEPELPGGLRQFGPGRQETLAEQGFLTTEGGFELGRVLFEEFHYHRPDECFVDSDVPALVIHGDRDTYVSHAIAQRTAATKDDCEFHTVAGAEHGFAAPQHGEEAVTLTVDWLVARHGGG